MLPHIGPLTDLLSNSTEQSPSWDFNNRLTGAKKKSPCFMKSEISWTQIKTLLPAMSRPPSWSFLYFRQKFFFNFSFLAFVMHAPHNVIFSILPLLLSVRSKYPSAHPTPTFTLRSSVLETKFQTHSVYLNFYVFLKDTLWQKIPHWMIISIPRFLYS
jgi:hypothetical protein